MLGGQVFRTVSSTAWNPEKRVADLDAAGVSHQVVSPVPVNLVYHADAKTLAAHLRHVNEGLADFASRTHGRVTAWAAVPLQDVDLAVAELEYAVTRLGMGGVEIGAHVNGIELDDPSLFPFFQAAEALGAVVFVHPLDGGADVVRRGGQPWDFGLGMLTDTALAAGALVLGGVLTRLPRLRVLLAHGGGSFPWVWPRLLRGSRLVPDALSPDRLAEAITRIWVDSLTFDPLHLGLLGQLLGAENIVLGTDYPFMKGELEGAARQLLVAPEQGLLDRDGVLRTLGRNGHLLLSAPTDT
jgi:aminocarboxymuconate-semialdehyde decarboxylase